MVRAQHWLTWTKFSQIQSTVRINYTGNINQSQPSPIPFNNLKLSFTSQATTQCGGERTGFTIYTVECGVVVFEQESNVLMSYTFIYSIISLF